MIVVSNRGAKPKQGETNQWHYAQMTIDRSLVDELEYSYSEADTVESSSSEGGEHSPLSKRQAYFNNIGEDLIVVDRSGIPMLIQTQSGRSGGLVIDRVYHVGRGVEVDPTNVSRFEGGSTKERVAFNRAIDDYDKEEFSANRRLSVSYTIDRNKLLNSEHPLYIPEVDIVVALKRKHETRKVLHPYSDTSARFRILKEAVENSDRKGFKYELFIVSNDRTHGDRYVNILGDVYKVPAIVNQTLQDGVYVCSSGSVVNGDGKRPCNYKHYSFEEAREAISLYVSVDEAKTFGDPQGEREREFRRLENQFKQEKLELEMEMTRDKHEREKLRAEQAELLAELDHYRKLKEMKDKDYYEDRSRVRKDNSEIIKYVPAIITGILAIVTLAVKLSDKK